MPDTPTPVQDLAALDRVAVIASVAGLMTSGLAVLLERLRISIVTAQERELALGRAFALKLGISNSAMRRAGLLSYAAAILAAVASVGAEIVWPTPDSGEVAERPSGDATAPGTAGVASVHGRCGRNPGCALADGHAGGCGFMTNITASQPSAREKILAEVAAVDLPVPAEAALRGIVNTACEIARGALPGVGRDEIVRAAAMLVLAVERLDGAR